jgi:hypothetical protein
MRPTVCPSAYARVAGWPGVVVHDDERVRLRCRVLWQRRSVLGDGKLNVRSRLAR